MTDDQPPATTRHPLTDLQRTRLDYARRDLESARAEELADITADGLILIIERLRIRLDDTIHLVEELTDDTSAH